MSQSYSELVVSAPFLLCKGFLMGFMHGCDKPFDYFFPRKKGVRKESLGEFIRETLDFDVHTHLCLPQSVLDSFRKAVKSAEPIIDMKIESEKEIGQSDFSFSFQIHNEDQAQACRKLIGSAKGKITLENYHPSEIRRENLVAVQEYAPIHPYIFEGHGTARGAFAEVMHFYLSIKKSDLADSILMSELHYELGDGE
ncbi:hypothetical protein JW992_16120 [candidate division KSB1 bacterium]|nr:hypothetical protein [candidate division KSB1 bacterium]